MEKELYEKRVNEIVNSYLKNIKECDQNPMKKTPWVEKSSNLVMNQIPLNKT